MEKYSWVKLVDFPMYEICKETQQVRKIENKQVISQRYDKKNGYLRLNLYYDKNKYKTVKIHRLMAEVFIPNTYNKETVNHIDGNKLNNHISNLEWATYSENIKHAYENGLNYHIYDPEDYPNNRTTVLITNSLGTTECNSLREASRIIGCSHSTISKRLKESRNNTCEVKGFKIKIS